MIFFLFWAVAGAATHLLTVEQDDGPWWLTAAVVLSWPVMLLSHYTNVHVEIGIFEFLEDEGDD